MEQPLGTWCYINGTACNSSGCSLRYLQSRRWGGAGPRMDMRTAALCKGAATTQRMLTVAMHNGTPRVVRPDFFEEKPEI